MEVGSSSLSPRHWSVAICGEKAPRPGVATCCTLQVYILKGPSSNGLRSGYHGSGHIHLRPRCRARTQRPGVRIVIFADHSVVAYLQARSIHLEAPNISVDEKWRANVSPLHRWRLCRVQFNTTSFCCHTEEHLEVCVVHILRPHIHPLQWCSQNDPGQDRQKLKVDLVASVTDGQCSACPISINTQSVILPQQQFCRIQICRPL